MKTAVSIPDALFARADQYANDHGLSRSELYASALHAYLEESDSTLMTAAINEAIDATGDDDEATRDLVEYGKRRLARDADRW